MIPNFSLDPIKAAVAPYALALKATAAVCVIGAAFVGGCNHGTDSQRDKDDKRIRNADAAVEAASTRAVNAEDALRLINKTTEIAKKAEAERKRQADTLVKQAQLEAKQQARRAADLEDQLEEARRIPDCERVLKENLCAAIPLL